MLRRWSSLMALFVVMALVFAVACGDDEDDDAPGGCRAHDGACSHHSTGGHDGPRSHTHGSGDDDGGEARPSWSGMFSSHLTVSHPRLEGLSSSTAGPTSLCEGLTALDTPAITRGEFPPPVPNLATEWDVSADGTVYTFKIRSGVKFTTGRPVTAEAVKKSIEYATFALDHEKLLGRFGWTSAIDTIEAPSDDTLIIRLNGPYAPLLGNMASKSLFIVDAEELLANQEKDEEGNDDRGINWGRTHSACTGPFMIESWEAEQRLTIKANPDYWGGHDGVQPSFGRIIISHIPENSTAELQVGAGEVDLGFQLDPASVPGFEANANVEIFSYPSLITCNFLMDRRAPPLENDDVFKAVRYAVDYEGLRDVVAGGLANVHQSLILPGMQGHDPAIAMRYEHNPAKAMELLASAGYPDGFDIEIHLRTGSCGSVPYQKAPRVLPEQPETGWNQRHHRPVHQRQVLGRHRGRDLPRHGHIRPGRNHTGR